MQGGLQLFDGTMDFRPSASSWKWCITALVRSMLIWASLALPFHSRHFSRSTSPAITAFAAARSGSSTDRPAAACFKCCSRMAIWNCAEWYRAGLRVGTSMTEGAANFMVNRRMGSVATFGHGPPVICERESTYLSGGNFEQCGDEFRLRLDVTTADVPNLPLPDHCHRLVACQRSSRRPEAAKAKPWTG
jgi:hypothetical protein